MLEEDEIATEVFEVEAEVDGGTGGEAILEEALIVAEKQLSTGQE